MIFETEVEETSSFFYLKNRLFENKILKQPNQTYSLFHLKKKEEEKHSQK